MNFFIKENSFIARIAARKLGTSNVAIVLGRTIYLHNATKEQFMENNSWLKHELVHLRQFSEHGYLPFVIKYLWESLKNGYRNNKFEIEARAGENDNEILNDATFI